MYLYNVTIIVESDISDAVKQYLQARLRDAREAAPQVSLLALLDSPHEGTTYCVQFRCAQQTDIAAFQRRHLDGFQTRLNEQYPGKVVFFDSTMKYLND